jgi:hypothetical protein
MSKKYEEGMETWIRCLSGRRGRQRGTKGSEDVKWH